MKVEERKRGKWWTNVRYQAWALSSGLIDARHPSGSALIKIPIVSHSIIFFTLPRLPRYSFRSFRSVIQRSIFLRSVSIRSRYAMPHRLPRSNKKPGKTLYSYNLTPINEHLFFPLSPRFIKPITRRIETITLSNFSVSTFFAPLTDRIAGASCRILTNKPLDLTLGIIRTTRFFIAARREKCMIFVPACVRIGQVTGFHRLPINDSALLDRGY